MKKLGFICFLTVLLHSFSGLVVFADTVCTETGNTIIQNESLPEGIDMSSVIGEATKKLKEEGVQNIPELMDIDLESGKLTQEDYDKYYPTAGAGYIDWVCYVEELTEQNLIESIIALVNASKGYNTFYISGFMGVSAGGSITLRIYRATM